MKYIPLILVILILIFLAYTIPMLFEEPKSATEITSEVLAQPLTTVKDKNGNDVATVSPDGTMVVLKDGKTLKDYKRYSHPKPLDK